MNPFSTNPDDTLATLGERALLNLVNRSLGSANPRSPEGMGDDCAVCLHPPGGSQLTTVDALVWQVHFDESASPEQAAHKLLHRNLSDIAAMGGIADRGVLTLLAGCDLRENWLQRFCHYLGEEASHQLFKIVGGDCTEGPSGTFAATLTALGHTARPLLRTGADTGDWLMVTGELGGSILGHHLSFTARVKEGRWLSSRPPVKAMIDLSDGLAKDLPELVPPGNTAVLDTSQLPLSQAAHTRATQSGLSALRHALGDGEDHELLFALDQNRDPAAFQRRWQEEFQTPLTRIGRLEDARGRPAIVDADDEPLLDESGFLHFG